MNWPISEYNPLTLGISEADTLNYDQPLTDEERMLIGLIGELELARKERDRHRNALAGVMRLLHERFDEPTANILLDGITLKTLEKLGKENE